MRSRVVGLIEPKSFLALLSCVSIATCTACSSGYKFSAAFPNLFSESNPNSAADESEGDGVSTVSDGSPGNSENNKSIISIEDPELEEIPAVEVAGSNLISICFDLDTHGRAEDSAAIHCSVANKSKQAVLLKADAFKLQSAHERAEYLARGVSPIPKSPASGWDMLPEEKIEKPAWGCRALRENL